MFHSLRLLWTSFRRKYHVCRTERITRNDAEDYLWRLTFFKLPAFGVFLHRFLASDNLCLHDHPFPFVSIVLWSGYWEWTECHNAYQICAAFEAGDLVREGQDMEYGALVLRPPVYRRRWYRIGSILFRPANWLHRIEVPKSGRTWTLVLIGRKCRQWGFQTPHGWIPHNRYSHVQHCS